MKLRVVLVFLIVLNFSVFLSLNLDFEKDCEIVYEDSNIKQYSTSFELEESLADNDLVSVLINLDYDKYEVIKQNDNVLSKSSVNDYNLNIRDNGKKYHYEKNKEYLKEIKVSNYRDIYVSKYMPFIEVLYEKDTFVNCKNEILDSIKSNKNIKKIFVNTERKSKDNIEDAIEASNGTEYIASDLYRGAGVKVGILESSIINVEHSNLSGVTKYTYDNPWMIDSPSDHATAMASIIAGQSTGIAPDVSIYSAGIKFGLSDEFDWFIENDVDVINMSFGETNLTGEYSADSAMADYVSCTYNIVMVAATGNNGETDGYVGNPALGYNVLSVGNCSSKSTMNGSSSYQEVIGPEKPNLVTRGTAILVPGFGCPNGTSTSCAVMTGFVACLLSQYPNLKLYPEKVIALTMSNSFPMLGYSHLQSNGVNEYTGAGLFNLQSASDNYSGVQAMHNTSTTTTDTLIATYSKYYSSGAEVNVACFWPAYATGDEDETEYTTYRMELYNTVGQLVDSVSCGRSNYMMFQNYEVLITGTYKVKIYQCSGLKNPNGDWISVGFGHSYS